MKNILLMPDSFKGTMSSIEVCDIMEKAILDTNSSYKVRKIPIADGGEGTVDCFLAAVGGEKIYVEVNNSNFQKTNVYYGLIKDKKTAVIEIASCVGLPQTSIKNPEITTTYGVGELILDAIDKGVNEIILALGGSSTNDCGVGMLCALGAVFFDKDGKKFVPTGGTLSRINKIETNYLNKKIEAIKFTAMCDVDNPLCGEKGAAYVYSPQKGADEIMVKNLDNNLVAFSQFCEKNNFCGNSNFKGAGAAGGTAYGAKYFLGANIIMGIEVLLKVINFEKLLLDTNLIITGEGKIDSQSLSGKVVVGIAKRAKNVPVIAVVGDIAEGAEKVYDLGVNAIFSINRVALPYDKIKNRAKRDLYDTIKDIIKLITVSQNL